MKKAIILILASMLLTGCFGVQLLVKRFGDTDNYNPAQKRIYTSITNFVSNATTTNNYKIQK